tara:strand:+ start:579 stop:824 length:246 start_codon:yes stop_codon:yes gene_type:complete
VSGPVIPPYFTRIITIILILIITGEAMSGPQYRKKLGDRHPQITLPSHPVMKKEVKKKSIWDKVWESYDPSPYNKIKIKIK